MEREGTAPIFRAEETRTAGEGAPTPQAVLDLWHVKDDAASPEFLVDAAGNLIYANAAYERIAPFLGGAMELPIDDVVASIEALGHPLRQDVVLRIDGRSECYIAERMVVRDASGRPFAVMGRLVPASEGSRIEAALALAENRLEDVGRFLPGWIWEVDGDLRVRFVSRRVLDDLGFHPSELIGRDLRDLIDPPGAFAGLKAQRSRSPFRDLLVSMRARNGAPRTFRLRGVPVFDCETGHFRGYRGMAQDVTERETQFAALAAAADNAEAASRAKSEFLASLSHELRTPLNAIMGFAEVMKRELLGPLGHGKYREYSEDILTSARHLLNLVNDLLDITKIEAGHLDLDERDVAPSDLLTTAQRLVAEHAARAGITLRVLLEPELPRLRADERRLTQILLNLLSNAIKFTPSGGEVTLGARRTDDGGIEFLVSDTGIGIDPEDIAIAMAPFRQIATGPAGKQEGTGLGLPLSKALTELHGGTFRLESEVGKGTRAYVRLPASRVIGG